MEDALTSLAVENPFKYSVRINVGSQEVGLIGKHLKHLSMKPVVPTSDLPLLYLIHHLNDEITEIYDEQRTLD